LGKGEEEIMQAMILRKGVAVSLCSAGLEALTRTFGGKNEEMGL